MILLFLMTFSFAAQLQNGVLVSPFPSTVPGISIPNTHLVAKDKGVVLRGMMPLTQKDANDLAKYGITNILIFRNDIRGESTTSDEIKKLEAAHFERRDIVQIPFLWKNITNFKKACSRSIQALKMIDETLSKERQGLFFHCTVGEDRTGYLAGLYRVVFEDKNPEDVFENEMCAHGYSAGDHTKPPEVSKLVDSNITPLYLKMSELVRRGKLNKNNLDVTVCNQDPIKSVEFKRKLKKDLLSYKCKPKFN